MVTWGSNVCVSETLLADNALAGKTWGRQNSVVNASISLGKVLRKLCCHPVVMSTPPRMRCVHKAEPHCHPGSY